MPPTSLPEWPVLTRYDQEHLVKIALPLGGIGTGTVSLGGRGNLRDWEIMNRPAKGFAPKRSFFAIYARPAGSEAFTRALEGPIDVSEYQGPEDAGIHGSGNLDHGMPRFRKCSFEAAYPLGQVRLSDSDAPVDVRIQAFNPLVPADTEASGIPVGVLRFLVTNKTTRTVNASVSGSLENYIGYDGSEGRPSRNVNEYRKKTGRSPVQGIFMSSDGVNPQAEQSGTIALVTTAARGVTHRTAWAKSHTPPNSLVDFWDDFQADGRLEEREYQGEDAPQASLAVSMRIPPKGTRNATFLLTWHFPNRRAWAPTLGEYLEWQKEGEPDRLRNYYTTQYEDAWDVAVRTAASLKRLEAETLTFVRSLCESDIPDVVKEAALFNLHALRTETTFRTDDGLFYGWEGCYDNAGSCPGSCTHVWNYEQATPYLFGSLARSMREVEFHHSTRDDGHMSFRTLLPLGRATEWGIAAADGQMGCIMKLYRDWQLSGDDVMLRRLWPKARKAMEFCWVPGGWDADRDGVMEGCQHNTLDVEYFGPNPVMGCWYLGALRAAEEMARHLGENPFAETCRGLFEKGSAWMDANLFNGEYYEQQVHPPGDSPIADGLHYPLDAIDLDDPEMQLGAGCQLDQLVGQYMAHICGLGHLLAPEKVRSTLRSVIKYNFRDDHSDHFNPFNSFVLGSEPGMATVTYPRGRRPRVPVPAYAMVMTGFEYTAAAHMIFEGQVANGLKAIAAVRSRYDGRKRNPFDEAEAGHHYARAMAGWAALLALTGFRYSAVRQSIAFAASEKPSKVFWSNGSAWGTCRQRPVANGAEVELTVLHGSLRLREFALDGLGTLTLKRPRVIRKGKSEVFALLSAVVR